MPDTSPITDPDWSQMPPSPFLPRASEAHGRNIHVRRERKKQYGKCQWCDPSRSRDVFIITVWPDIRLRICENCAYFLWLNLGYPKPDKPKQTGPRMPQYIQAIQRREREAGGGA